MRPIDIKNYPIPVGGKFGDPRDGGIRKHVGTDYLTPRGTKTRASKDGRVSLRNFNDQRGIYLKFHNEDGTQSLQQHLNKVLVEVGQKVKQGQIVAETGDTGVGGAHLHVEEFNKSGKNIDPEKVYTASMYKGKLAKYWYERAQHYRQRTLLFKGIVTKIKKLVGKA